VETRAPEPAGRLEASRLGDRDTRQREQGSAPRKAPAQASPARQGDLELGAEIDNREDSHQFDERA
jgi:hypothetical protein